MSIPTIGIGAGRAATARSSCSTTCWGWAPARCRVTPRRMPISAARSPRPSAAIATKSAAASSPAAGTDRFGDDHAQPPRPAKPAPTCCNTPTIRWTGFPGGPRRWRRPCGKRNRSSSRSAIRPAIGATSWPHECFEDAEIARLLNENFISIKVDREERPDLDQVYMEAVQWLTGGGGWPLSVFLTPEREPFFGGTYWPPRRRDSMPGFDEVLAAVAAAWARRRGEVSQQAQRVMRGNPGRSLARRGRRPRSPAARCGRSRPDRSLRSAGGRIRPGAEIPPAPEPRASCCGAGRQTGDAALSNMVDTTLQHMARGRHLRSARRRLPPLQRRRPMARPPFRENALRQRPAGRLLHRGLARPPATRSTNASSAKRSTMSSAT